MCSWQMHFVTMAHALEARRAIVLSGLALVPYISPCVYHFVHLWRASSVLGEELLEDYISHIIEHVQRDSFFQCDPPSSSKAFLPLLPLPLPYSICGAAFLDRQVRKPGMLAVHWLHITRHPPSDQHMPITIGSPADRPSTAAISALPRCL